MSWTRNTKPKATGFIECPNCRVMIHIGEAVRCPICKRYLVVSGEQTKTNKTKSFVHSALKG